MRIFMFLAMALCLGVTAMADEITFSWEPPVERMNGVPFDPVTELERYDIQCATDSHSITEVVPGYSDVSEHSFSQAKVFSNNYGEYKCTVSAVDSDGLRSDPAGPLYVAWEPTRPKPPGSFNAF